MIRLILPLFLFFSLINCSHAAIVSVSHSMTLNSNAKKVVEVCRENRHKIMESSGLRILAAYPDNRYRVRVADMVFTVQENRNYTSNSLTVQWFLVESDSKMKSYSSIIQFTSNPKGGTDINGKVDVEVDRRRGENIIKVEVWGGITKMQRTLKSLLDER